MSATESSSSSPENPPQSAYAPVDPNRALGLIPIAAIAIFLGVIGIAAVIGGLVDLLFGDQIDYVSGMGMQQPYAEMQESLQAIQDAYRIPKAILLPLNLIVSTLLIVGSILVLRRVNSALLRTACWMGVVLELFYLILIVMLQLQTIPVMEKAMSGLSGGTGSAIASIFSFVGLAFTGVWFLAKEAFYIWAAFYLAKPHVKANFPNRS
ncbi:MAG: hypothetical protein JNL67_01020 [Planctomycetaceae bacterium]|nr:hypothetical protein [Planctomycetaceae bacterium]